LARWHTDGEVLMDSEREKPAQGAEPPRPPDAVTPSESSYLDLDGDGIPDAVKTSRTLGYDVTGDGAIDVVETIDEVASEIDIAGVPHHVEVTDTLEADVHHDGALEVVDVVSVHADRSEALAETGRSPRRRRGPVGRDVLARARARIRRRGGAPGFAATRVAPAPMLQALRHVTSCSSREGDIRVSIDRDVVGLAVHSPHAGWWAATAVRARLRRGAPTALTVERADLEAVLVKAAETHPRGVPFIVRGGEALWVSGDEVDSVTELDRVVPLPPHLQSWEPLERDVVVPTIDSTEGETTFPFARGEITTTNSLLRALAALGIGRVAVFEGDGRVFLLGSSTEERAVSQVVVTGEARLRYS
jgi:hypothetical protein